jgi:hypothetical protein
MTDPLRSDTSAAQAPEREREARVEELLLGGLDHYFAGRHDLAINVWTRVLFLDRGHARARAYTERARGAIAERQRQGEELVQTGAAAFERGESEVARHLLTSAVEHGAGTEEAIALLARLDRLAAAGVPQENRAAPAPQRLVVETGARARVADRSWLRWTVAGAAIGATTVVIALGVFWGTTGASQSASPAAAIRPSDEPLPVPSAADVWLIRARAQKDRGHLREALVALDAIGSGDRRSAEAEKLRVEIQGALLAAGRAAAFGSNATAKDSGAR